MKFRDDIDPANTWLVSDTHFGHDNIVGFCHRLEDHEQVMIVEWRAYVPDDATVLHLGDLSYRSNGRFKHLLSKELTGARKLLIKGNHDRQSMSFYRQCGFQLVRPFMIPFGYELPFEIMRPMTTGTESFRNAGHTVSFSHYAWSAEEMGRPMGDRDIRIHGHIHNNGYSRDSFVPFLRGHINLSVEQTKYRPVNLKALLDAYIYGVFDETTEAQFAEARVRHAAAKDGR